MVHGHCGWTSRCEPQSSLSSAQPIHSVGYCRADRPAAAAISCRKVSVSHCPMTMIGICSVGVYSVRMKAGGASPQLAASEQPP